MSDEFRCQQLPESADLFDALVGAVRFDDVTRGRRGTVIVRPDARGVPIVRTTTPYRTPAQLFGELHIALAPSGANNALVEHYTDAYATMKSHSDQALDLADDASIAIYSCYRDPARPSRRLVVRAKDSGATTVVPLPHHGLVTFSLDTNRRFVHAIELAAPGNEWLGITFRTSKSFVRFVDGQPRLGGQPLTLATEDQRKELFQLRRRENVETSFAYPPIAYTISESDLMPPA